MLCIFAMLVSSPPSNATIPLDGITAMPAAHPHSWRTGSTRGLAAMFGMHVWPTLAVGRMGSRAGPLMGAAQQFNVAVRGRGAHAAMPHLGTDPILAAAHTIAALQVTPQRARVRMLPSIQKPC